MLELHLHGSTAVMKSILRTLSTFSSFRPAEPGEFTRLAFDNGKMDLTEVEGLRDLIESETEAQRKLAVLQAGGDMRKAYEAMRKDIISAMSVTEAMIDFGEDEQIEQETFDLGELSLFLARRRVSYILKWLLVLVSTSRPAHHSAAK
jgi:tRNA modification GTPase